MRTYSLRKADALKKPPALHKQVTLQLPEHTLKPRQQNTNRGAVHYPPISSRSISSGPIAQGNRKRESLWYAVCFAYLQQPGSAEDYQRLQQLAELILQLSARVSLQPPDSIVFEVRSSLRYFGGIANIRNRLQLLLHTQLEHWGLDTDFYHAATPTPASSVLLARNKANVLVYQTSNLRSVLGQLPLASLPITRRDNEKFRKTGLFYLRDIWRLSTAGLRQRFGREFVNYLDRCLGKCADPLRVLEPAPTFQSRHELDYPVDNIIRLLPVFQELIDQLCGFLQQRELCTSHLLVLVEHEEQTPTIIEMHLRRAARSPKHLFLLLENRCRTLVLSAPVMAATLKSEHFDRFFAENKSLLDENSDEAAAGGNTSFTDLLEQLQARLGDNVIRTLQALPEHRPEYACKNYSYNDADTKKQKIKFSAISSGLRPCWLLERPYPLQEKNGHIYLTGTLATGGSTTPIQIISEMERIESGWWADADTRRDYYIAANRQGQLLWIFKARSQMTGWYLHGFF